MGNNIYIKGVDTQLFLCKIGYVNGNGKPAFFRRTNGDELTKLLGENHKDARLLEAANIYNGGKPAIEILDLNSGYILGLYGNDNILERYSEVGIIYDLGVSQNKEYEIRAIKK